MRRDGHHVREAVEDEDSPMEDRRQRLRARFGRRFRGPGDARRRVRRRLPPASVIPTLCTLGNLVAGFAAIHYASREPNVRVLWHDWTPLTVAGAMVFLGMLLDAFDGALARLTRSNSELGAQLDSLSDIVTFGVAPAFLTLRLVQNHLQSPSFIIGLEADNILGKIIWVAAAVYVCCAALRLARFNVETGGPSTVNDHSLFRGLPSPGAAGTVASLVLLHQHLLVTRFGGGPVHAGETLNADVPMGFVQWAALGIPLIMLICAFGMVSNIPYIHFANRYFRGRRSFRFILIVVFVLFVTVIVPFEAVALGFTVYALSGPVRLLVHKLRMRSGSTSPPSAPGAPAT